MQVIICGGRDYRLMLSDYDWLDILHATHDITEVFHGGASGADADAAAWARTRRITQRVFLAQWQKEGRAAGPLRNARMLDALQQGAGFGPRAVIAFPGGRGTADMIAKARAVGVRVWERQGLTNKPLTPQEMP